MKVDAVSLPRRRFLRGQFGSLPTACAFHDERRSIFPPGMESFERLYLNCDGCGDCIAVCPKKIIELRGSPPLPVLTFSTAGCAFCEGYPCASACTRNALTLPMTKPRLGMATILNEFCIASEGADCRVCASACPRNVIEFPDGIPAVNASCDGCGVCLPACSAVASPPAIAIEPRRETP
jgi:ferredoxin-type protein NapF